MYKIKYLLKQASKIPLEHCLNILAMCNELDRIAFCNFLADCLSRKSGHTSLTKLIQLICSGWDVIPLVAFYLLCLTSLCLF